MTDKTGMNRTLVGRVVSDKMQKSCIVATERRVQHGLYGKMQKRTSRFVRMPTRRPGRLAPSTTGMPEMPWAPMSALASASVASGPMVTGLTTMPLSNFFTAFTSFVLSVGVLYLRRVCFHF